jgi:hypothetical protein
VIALGPDSPRVRAQPSTAAQQIGSIPLNTIVNVSGLQVAGNGQIWFLVNVNLGTAGVVGWVRSDLVQQIEPCPEFPAS